MFTKLPFLLYLSFSNYTATPGMSLLLMSIGISWKIYICFTSFKKHSLIYYGLTPTTLLFGFCFYCAYSFKFINMLLYNSLYIYFTHIQVYYVQIKANNIWFSQFPLYHLFFSCQSTQFPGVLGGGGRAVLVVNRLCQIN